MVRNPKNKYEIPPVKIPAFDVKLIEGSPVGKISTSEWIYALVKPWAWHLTAMFLVTLGFAADYLHVNVAWIESKYGGFYASLAFGITGLIRSYQLTRLIKSQDTTGEE